MIWHLDRCWKPNLSSHFWWHIEFLSAEQCVTNILDKGGLSETVFNMTMSINTLLIFSGIIDPNGGIYRIRFLTCDRISLKGEIRISGFVSRITLGYLRRCNSCIFMKVSETESSFQFKNLLENVKNETIDQLESLLSFVCMTIKRFIQAPWSK